MTVSSDNTTDVGVDRIWSVCRILERKNTSSSLADNVYAFGVFDTVMANIHIDGVRDIYVEEGVIL